MKKERIYKNSAAYKYLIDKKTYSLLRFSGVYKIGFIGSKNFYIGSSTISIRIRFSRHFSDLKSQKHYNKILQKAYNKYQGLITLEILEVCSSEECLSKEQYYIDLYNPVYNICKIAGNTLGVKSSEKFILKKSKPVDMFDLLGNYIQTFKSISECSRQTGLCSTRIGLSARSNSRTGKFRFKYSGLYNQLDKHVNPESIPILCYSIMGVFIRQYDSILSASKDLNIPVGNISKHLQNKHKSCYNYIFKHYQENFPLKIKSFQKQHKYQVKVIITNLITNEVVEFASINSVNYPNCSKDLISKKRKCLGDDFIIKNKYKIQIISYETNELIKTI